MAIWDALGNRWTLLYALLGGEPGLLEPTILMVSQLVPPEKIEEQASYLVDQGNFNALKIRLGRDKLADDIEAISRVRKAVGGIILMVILIKVTL